MQQNIANENSPKKKLIKISKFQTQLKSFCPTQINFPHKLLKIRKN